jgi:hypothetical protein
MTYIVAGGNDFDANGGVRPAGRQRVELRVTCARRASRDDRYEFKEAGGRNRDRAADSRGFAGEPTGPIIVRFATPVKGAEAAGAAVVAS